MTSHLALRVAFSLKIHMINYMSLSKWRACAKVIEAIRSAGVGVKVVVSQLLWVLGTGISKEQYIYS